MSSPYQYEELDGREGEIRILKLLPGRPGDPISGILKRFSRCAKPRYDALSYIWGDVNPPQTLIVNRNFTLQITPNLAQALSDVRHPFKARMLWVDAVCINQSDLEEKSKQVQAMGTTFANARCVRAYLNAEINPKDPAFRALGRIAPITYIPVQNDDAGRDPVHLHSHLEHLELFALICTLTYYTPNFAIESQLSKGTHMLCWLGLKKRVQDFDTNIWDALLPIVESPYWRRIWIQQEITLARKLKLHCHRNVIDGKQWLKFEHAFRSSGDSDVVDFPTHWAYSYKAACGNHRLPPPTVFSRGCILDIFLKAGDFNTTDPRDRVYGLLGVARDHVEGQIEVNYKLSLRQVYMQVMQHHVRTWKNLNFLCVRQAGPVHEKLKDLKLLTWLPCPERGLELYCHSIRTSGASGNLPTQDTWFDMDTLSMHVRGIMQGKCRLVGSARFDENTPIAAWLLGLRSLCAGVSTQIDTVSQLMALTRHEWEATGHTGADPKIFVRVKADKEIRMRNFCLNLFSGAYGRELPSKSLFELRFSEDKAKVPELEENGTILYELSCAAGATFFTADSLGIGMVYLFDPQNDVQTNDEVWVLFGCPRAMVLRRVLSQEMHYTVVGSAIIPSLMNGQAVKGINVSGEPTPEYEGNPISSIVLK